MFTMLHYHEGVTLKVEVIAEGRIELLAVNYKHTISVDSPPATEFWREHLNCDQGSLNTESPFVVSLGPD